MAVIYASPGDNLSGLANIMAPGDTLQLSADTYYERLDLTSSGAPGAPKTIAGDPGAIIDGSRTNLPQYGEQVRVRGSHWRLDGFTLRACRNRGQVGAGKGIGVGDSGTGVTVTDVTLSNLTIHDIDEMAFLVERSDGVIVEDCELFDLTVHYINNRAGDWPGGMAFANGALNGIIRRCKIYRVYGEAVAFIFGSHGCVMEECEISQYWGPVYADASNNCTFRRNLFYYAPLPADPTDQKRALTIAHESSRQALAQPAITGATIENNIFVNWPGYAITVDRYVGAPAVTGVVIRNNTFCCGAASKGAIDGGGNAGCRGRIENNLYPNLDNHNLAGWTIANNCSQRAQTFAGVGLVKGDPKLVNAAATVTAGHCDANGYRIGEGSSCAGAGLALGVGMDYFGATRSQTAPSIGAHEYEGEFVTEPVEPVDPPKPVGGCINNIISNGNFVNMDNWSQAVGTGSINAVAGAAVAVLPKLIGFNQLYQAGVVVKSQPYRLTFKASGPEGARIGVQLLGHLSPYRPLGLDQEITLSTTATVYTVDFVGTANSNARFRFAFNHMPGNYVIREVCLGDVPDVVVEPPVEPEIDQVALRAWVADGKALAAGDDALLAAIQQRFTMWRAWLGRGDVFLS